MLSAFAEDEGVVLSRLGVVVRGFVPLVGATVHSSMSSGEHIAPFVQDPRILKLRLCSCRRLPLHRRGRSDRIDALGEMIIVAIGTMDVFKNIKIARTLPSRNMRQKYVLQPWMQILHTLYSS